MNVDYIISNKDVYVRLDENGKPVTCNKQDVQRFEYSKAYNILENLPKNLKRFHFKLQPVPEISETKTLEKAPNSNLPKVRVVKRKIKDEKIDLARIKPDKHVITGAYELPEQITIWLDKVQSLNGLAKQARIRKLELMEKESQIDREKVNCEHEIEFTKKVNACEGYKMFRNYQMVLEKRRQIKDERVVVDAILKSNLGQIASEQIAKSVEGLKHRKYTYR